VFKELFAGDGRFQLQLERGRSSWFGFTIIPLSVPRSRLLGPMREAGIEFRQITGGNFLQHPAAECYDYVVHGDGCPNAALIHDRGFFVGNHATDLTEQLLRLRQVLDEAAR